MDIAAWLRELGLERYALVFQDSEIEPEILAELTDEDFKELGIPLGPRRKLAKAIAAVSAEAGTPPGRSAAVGSPATPPAQAERRHLTVMFVDLVGSTALAARLDPEDMREVITAYQNACAAVITRFEGHIAKYMGDGVLAYFGYPRAHEDDAERAVRAGLELAAAIRRPAANGATLAVRIGIATGQVVVGDLVGEGAAQEEAVVGETPNLAARLQSLAEPGTVVIAPGTRRLLGGMFELAELGERALKGFALPIRAWCVSGEGSSESRFEAARGDTLTPLVGRDDEMAILTRRWRLAEQSEGQVVLLSGEPGIGKSRLCAALRSHLAERPHTGLTYQCSRHHADSAFRPVINQLERAAGIRPEDDPACRLHRLEGLLEPSSDDLAEHVPILAALLSVPTQGRYPSSDHNPQQQKERTYRTLIYLVERLAARQPVLIVFEDLHWADPSTLELVDRLAAKAENLQVLLLATARPGFSPPWLDDAHVTLLAVRRISRRDCHALLDALAGPGSLPESMVDEIAAKSDGIPLFVEEMTRAVVEARASELTASIGGEAVVLPASLQDLLMARLDRLTFGKPVAQIAAAIGREFRPAALDPICDLSQDDLDRALNELTAAGLLSRRGATPNVSYIFKHALVQDAAYSSLLRVNRQKIHHRIVTTLGEDLMDQPAVLAHHWECAGELDQALEYRLAAGQGAAKQYALWEAIGQYWCALSLLEQMPETEATRRRHLEVVVALIGTGLMFWQSAAERAKALEHIDKALDTAKGTATLANLARLEAFKGNYWHDEAALRQALQHAAADGDGRLRAEVARRYAGYLGKIGQFETSHTHVERAIDIYAGLGAAFEQGMAMAVEGRCYHARAGEIGRSLQFARRAAEIAETTGDLRLKAWLAMESEPYMYQGLWKQAVDVVERNLPFAWEIGNWGVILFASAWATIAYLKLGRLAEARSLIEQAVTIAARRTAYEHHQIYPQIALAQMHLVAGETEASLSAGQRALALAERALHTMEEGAAHRILGQACEMKRSSEEAEAHFQRSLGVLRAIQSRPELAQSLLAYGRFRLRDDPGEGVRLLRDALALFEEMDATGWIEETRAALDASN